MIKTLWPLLWQILRFRRSPEDAPSSPALMALVVILNLGVSMGAQILPGELPAHVAAGMPAISLTVELVALWLLLNFKSVGFRFTQTVTVIFGGDLLLTLLALPLVGASMMLPQTSPLLAGLGILNLVLVAWGIGFRAFVYHRSLNVGIILANMLVLSLMLLSITLCTMAFPELLAKVQAMEQHP